MKPLFIWIVCCHDYEKQQDFTMAAFEKREDAVEECLWRKNHSVKLERFYIDMVRLYRPNENVLP